MHGLTLPMAWATSQGPSQCFAAWSALCRAVLCCERSRTCDFIASPYWSSCPPPPSLPPSPPLPPLRLPIVKLPTTQQGFLPGLAVLNVGQRVCNVNLSATSDRPAMHTAFTLQFKLVSFPSSSRSLRLCVAVTSASDASAGMCP